MQWSYKIKSLSVYRAITSLKDLDLSKQNRFIKYYTKSHQMLNRNH